MCTIGGYLSLTQRCLFHVLTEQNRRIELEMCADGTLLINNTNSSPTFTSMELVDSVNVSAECMRVHSYHGDTYIGVDDGRVMKMDDLGNVDAQFIKHSAHLVHGTRPFIHGITALEDKLYVLVGGLWRADMSTVHVHDLAGRHVSSWTPGRGCDHIVTVAGELVLADKHHGDVRLSVYSPSGELIKHIRTSVGRKLPVYEGITLCPIGADSVAITLHTAKPEHSVFRVHLPTEQVAWTSEHAIDHAGGVTCYDGQTLLVAHGRERTTDISLLDIRTGQCVNMVNVEGHKTNK